MKLASHILLQIAKRIPRGYWRVLKFAAERDSSLQDISISLKSISISLRGDLRESVFATLYRTGTIPHQTGFDLLWRRMLQPDDVVFDIGANIGYTTALFSDMVGPHGRVVAVEPSPHTFFLLWRSLSEIHNIELLNVGISRAAGKLALHVPKFLDRASFVPITGADELWVDVISLDDLCASHGHPRFIKVDVEGHEPSVFEGATAALAREDRPVVVFEALDRDHLEQCLALLTERSATGYTYRRIRNDGALVPLSEAGSSDYVALPSWAEQRGINLT